MSHRSTSVILATGGMGLVRAAYSSGKPAFGVGPGNVPAYIESTADVVKAVGDVLTGKSYDNGTLCCSEQALICDEAIAQQVKEQVLKQGGVFLTPEQVRAVETIAITPSRLANPQIVGKAATYIAQKAGITVPAGTRVLVAELNGVGRDYPLSIEKLSPILAFYVVRDWQEACERCKEILRYGGMGHTLAIHSQNRDVIMEFALQKPAFRIIVNSPATHGAVGFSTGLDPAMTLGCGAYGGNITSDNITPLHLINIKRLAFEMRPVDLKAAVAQYEAQQVPTPPTRPASPVVAGVVPSIEERVEQFLFGRGLRVGIHEKPGHSAPGPSASAREANPGRRETKEPSPTRPLEFVSEDDVRQALEDGRKLPIGPATVLTPAARELGNENGIFIRV